MGSKLAELSKTPLMNPLADVMKNMDFDLYTNLENFLQIIREHNVDNFSFAALLVQNSVQIYVKKVDFLFQMIVELLQIVTKNQTKKNTDEEAVENNHVEKKKKKTPTVPTDELQNLEEFRTCKDMSPVDSTTGHKDFIAINGASQVKPKLTSYCYVYDKKGELMGRKDEFKIHWRIDSYGNMLEDFCSENTRMLKTQVWLNDTDELEDDDHDHEPNLPNGVDNVSIGAPDEHHSFEQEPEECLKHLGGKNRPDENLVNEEEIQSLQWKPVDQSDEIMEKPISRKKVTKVPDEIKAVEARKENKRKWTEFKMILNNYDITYFVVMDHRKRQNTFNFDVDLSSLERKEMRLQKQLSLRRRIRYNEMLAREARQDLCDDFHGFCDMEHDEMDGFAGFGEDDDDDNRENCVGRNIDVPLPEQELFHDDGVERVLNDNSYEDNARKALQDYRAMKDRILSRETDLAKRVAAWHRTIMPKLEAAEERAHFDIHEYGSKILDKFPKSNGQFTLPFSDIVHNEPPEEVARYFLSSLMLANTYNVEISKTDPKELSVDCTNLTLLSRTRHYEELDDNMRITSNDKH